VIPSWYAQTIARGENEFTVTNSRSLRSKLRSEVISMGHKIVTIVNGDTYYVYDAVAMTGFFDRQTGKTRCREYVDWAACVPATEAFFQPEPGIQFERFDLEEYIQKALHEKSLAPIPILSGEPHRAAP